MYLTPMFFRLLSFCLLLSSSCTSTAITINKGGLYSGLQYTETVEIQTDELVIFDGCHFVGSNTAIEASYSGGSNLEIRNCVFTGKNPNRYKETQGRTVNLNGYDKSMIFRFENNTGVGFRGIMLQEMAYGSEIRVAYNEWSNIQGRMSDGNGGYLSEPDPNPENSQFIMIAEVTGAEIEVSWNNIHHDAYASKVEDVINLFACKGRSNQPIQIVHNLIEGAYPANPGYDKDYSGSGIQVEQESQYVEIAHNTILNAGNTGIALSWASKCKVYDNVIISTGELPDDDGRLCQSWRGLLIGNPFWHPDDSKENEAYQNTVWYVENIAPNGGCDIESQALAPIECMEGNICHDNHQPEGLPIRSDELKARQQWLDAATATGRKVGHGVE